MNVQKFSLMSLALMGAFSNAVAQEKEEEIELDPITITASLTPVSASKTGRNILIIKGDVLQKLPVQSIDELLRYVPGVEVQSRGPMGAQGDICHDYWRRERFQDLAGNEAFAKQLRQVASRTKKDGRRIRRRLYHSDARREDLL